MNVTFSDFLDPHRYHKWRPSPGIWLLTLLLGPVLPISSSASHCWCRHVCTPHPAYPNCTFSTGSSGPRRDTRCTLRLWVALEENIWGTDIFRPWKWIYGWLSKKKEFLASAYLWVILEGNLLGKNLETRLPASNGPWLVILNHLKRRTQAELLVPPNHWYKLSGRRNYRNLLAY